VALDLSAIGVIRDRRIMFSHRLSGARAPVRRVAITNKPHSHWRSRKPCVAEYFALVSVTSSATVPSLIKMFFLGIGKEVFTTEA
jgi:hypothetical protein